MLIGQWSLDAFLKYIQKQVQEFTKGVSSIMLLNSDVYTVPDKQSGTKDPRVPNSLKNFATTNYGAGAAIQSIWARFALDH